MKRAIIFSVVAFLVSLGGTTGFLVKRHTLPAVPAESSTATTDSTRTRAVGADSAPTAATATATGATQGHDSAATPPAMDSTRTIAVAARASAAVRPAAPAIDPLAKAGAYKQVARVLSAMKPPEAAKVIAFLSDDEVEGLLRAVGPRQAADFLSNIPKERAALLSRRLLTPMPVGASR